MSGNWAWRQAVCTILAISMINFTIQTTTGFDF